MTITAMIACDTDEVPPDNTRLGTDFFPLKVGNYSIYKVENTEYKVNGDVIETEFERKTEVVDSFQNQAGSLSYIIYTYERPSAGEEWTFTTAQTTRLNGNQAILVKDNVTFLKLSFPIENGKTWDGNALNSLPEDEYMMDSLFFTYISPAQDTISNTLTVIQEDNQDFTVELDRRYEVYALHMGLVYKEDVLLEYCTDTDCLGQQVIEEGHEYREYLLEFVEGP